MSQLPLITNQNVIIIIIQNKLGFRPSWVAASWQRRMAGQLALLARVMSLLPAELHNLSKLFWELGSLKSWNHQDTNVSIVTEKDRGPNGLSKDLLGTSWDETKQSRNLSRPNAHSVIWAVVLKGSLGHATFWKSHVSPFSKGILSVLKTSHLYSFCFFRILVLIYNISLI